MKKMLIAGLLFAIASFALTACGGAKEAEPTKAPAPAAPAPAPSVTGGVDPRITAIAQSVGARLTMPPLPSTAPKYGGSVTGCCVPAPKSLDPHKYSSYRNQIVSSFAREPLMRYPAGPGNSATDSTPLPRIAKSWEYSGDGLTLTIRLRDDVKWHNKEPVNGRLLTANDVVFTYKRAQNTPEFGRKTFIEAVSAISAPDDRTVVLKLSHTSAVLLPSLASQYFMIVPPEVEQKFGDYVTPETFIGTGPWVFKQQTPGVEESFERNPNYYLKDGKGNQLPFIEEVRWVHIDDYNAQDAAMRTSKLDLIGVETCGIDAPRYEAIKSDRPDIVWQIVPDHINGRGLNMQLNKAPWNNQKVRLAVAHAVDQKAWIKSALSGWGFPSTFTPPGFPDYWRPIDELPKASQDALTYDPELSKKLLAEAKAEGVDTSGSYSLVYSPEYPARYVAEAEFVAEVLNRVGFDIKLQSTEYTDFLNNYWIAGKYPDLMWAFGGFGYDPDVFIRDLFHSKGRAGITNHIQDTFLDNLLEQQSGVVDVAQRVKLVQQAEDYVIQKAYLYQGPAWLYIAGMQPWVKNYAYQLGGIGMSVGSQVMYAWIDKSK